MEKTTSFANIQQIAQKAPHIRVHYIQHSIGRTCARGHTHTHHNKAGRIHAPLNPSSSLYSPALGNQESTLSTVTASVFPSGLEESRLSAAEPRRSGIPQGLPISDSIGFAILGLRKGSTVGEFKRTRTAVFAEPRKFAFLILAGISPRASVENFGGPGESLLWSIGGPKFSQRDS